MNTSRTATTSVTTATVLSNNCIPKDPLPAATTSSTPLQNSYYFNSSHNQNQKTHPVIPPSKQQRRNKPQPQHKQQHHHQQQRQQYQQQQQQLIPRRGRGQTPIQTTATAKVLIQTKTTNKNLLQQPHYSNNNNHHHLNSSTLSSSSSSASSSPVLNHRTMMDRPSTISSDPLVTTPRASRPFLMTRKARAKTRVDATNNNNIHAAMICNETNNTPCHEDDVRTHASAPIPMAVSSTPPSSTSSTTTTNTTTTTNASNTPSSLSSSSSSSSKKKSRRPLLPFFKFRKQGKNPPTAPSNSSTPHWMGSKSKSALLNEFSLLMNEFPAQDSLNTTLHVACLKKYSEELIVHQLLVKGPAAVSMRNQRGDLPLHCAMRCKEGGSVGVENGVYDALVGAYPVGIQALNEDRCLPLHLACQSGGRNLYVIQKLVEAYPLGVIQKCHLKLPWRSDEDSLPSGGSSTTGSHLEGGGGGGAVDKNGEGTTWRSSFWSALLALSPMSSMDSESSPLSSPEKKQVQDAQDDVESCFTPLHLAVMNGAPPDVIELLLDANPMCLKMKTDRGRTPLDCAAFLISKHPNPSRTSTTTSHSNSISGEDYFENIDRAPIQNTMAAMEIMKSFQSNENKSLRLIQAAKMTSLSISDLGTSAQDKFDAQQAWKKLSHVIKFAKLLEKSSSPQSRLGPTVELDQKSAVAPPQDYRLPPNLSHVCIEIEIPVGFRRLRWAMMSSQSEFLTVEVLENKLGCSSIEMGPWDKLDQDIGQTDTHVPPNSSLAKSFQGAQRKCQYLMPKSGLVKATMAYETHTITEYNDYAFITHKVTNTPQVPFGSTFESHVQTIILNLGENRCKLIASVEAKFLEKPPMIAWKIKNAMYSGVTDYFVAKGETICEHAFQENSGVTCKN